jgi:hypothetical protein
VPLLSVLAESAVPLRRLNRETEARQRLDEAQRIGAPYRDKHSIASLQASEVLTRAQADWALAAGRPLEAVSFHRAFLAEADAAAKSDSAIFNPSREFVDAFLLTRRYRLLAHAARAAGLASEVSEAESKRRGIVEQWKKDVSGRPSLEAALLR